MHLVNARDLNLVLQKKINKRQEAFDKVLDNVNIQIQKAANGSKLFCLYEVPDFLIGFPLYDINECIAYIINKLHDNGFYVRYYFPRILYVSWNAAEIEDEKLKKDLERINGQNQLLLQHSSNAKKKPNAKNNTNKHIRSVVSKDKTNNTFLKSVKEFKPSGKFVLNLT